MGHRAWWRHQMEPFSALQAICAGNSPVTGEFPPQRPVTRTLDVFFDLRVNKRLSKQWWGWWFETPWGPLWRNCNDSGFQYRLIVSVMTWKYASRIKHRWPFSSGKTSVTGGSLHIRPIMRRILWCFPWTRCWTNSVIASYLTIMGHLCNEFRS